MKKFLSLLIKVLLVLFTYIAITSAAYVCFLKKASKKKHRDDCDYLLILGGDVIGANTPSPQLLGRMQTAVDYLQTNTRCTVIPCGGCFRPLQKQSEAQIISDYLIRHGIREERIVLENRSTTTYENFRFGSEIIQKIAGDRPQNVRIAFLTSDYHVFRAAAFAKCNGIKRPGIVSSPTTFHSMKRFWREYWVAYDMVYKILKYKWTSRTSFC